MLDFARRVLEHLKLVSDEIYPTNVPHGAATAFFQLHVDSVSSNTVPEMAKTVTCYFLYYLEI